MQRHLKYRLSLNGPKQLFSAVRRLLEGDDYLSLSGPWDEVAPRRRLEPLEMDWLVEMFDTISRPWRTRFVWPGKKEKSTPLCFEMLRSRNVALAICCELPEHVGKMIKQRHSSSIINQDAILGWVECVLEPTDACSLLPLLPPPVFFFFFLFFVIKLRAVQFIVLVLRLKPDK